MSNSDTHSGSRAHKEQLTAHLPTKSAKIRALHSAGYSRSEIADFLQVRYQHVRNVLVNDARVAGSAASTTDSATPGPLKIRVGPDGRIVIPAPFRDALGMKEGDALLASLEHGEIRLLSIPAAVRRVQAMVRNYVPEGVSLSDELIEDRRKEAEREGRNG